MNIYNHINSHFYSIIWTLIIILLSFIKLPEGQEPFIPYSDKIVHFGLYAILGFILYKEQVNNSIAILFIIFLGGGIEILQGILTDYRSADFFDFIADLIGGLLGLYYCKVFNIFKGIC